MDLLRLGERWDAPDATGILAIPIGAPVDCQACGHANPALHRFCGVCGRPLESSEGAAGLAAERRQLTILFADLAGSTRLSQHLDPEDLHLVVHAYQEVCARAITDFGGRVAQYLGDGILAYFGQPEAHEDDARRAVKAGLGIVRALPALNARLHHELSSDPAEPLHVRIAVHTGPVVVGQIGAMDWHERSALGRAPNVAARLQQIAELDTVVVSDDTRRLLGRSFELEDLGLVALRDVEGPVHTFIVRGERTPGDASLFAGEPALTPLVGRDADLDALVACWTAARNGRGQVMVVEGEPGIGKSRLVWALRERLAGDAPAWIECRCSPYHTSSAFHPVIKLIERRAGIEATDAAPERLAKLARSLPESGEQGDEALSLFAALLSLPTEHDARSSPEARRRRTLDLLLGWLLRSARAQPTVLVVEDAQWIDPSTRELVTQIVDRVGTVPLLVLVTQRPGADSGAHEKAQKQVLRALDPDETRRLVRDVAHPRKLPASVLEAVVRRTDGVPLFVEELTKTVIESLGADTREGARSPGVEADLPIPTTLQDSLTARLDRLGAVKRVAQLASVIGREFSSDVLAALSGTDEVGLMAALGRLVEAGLVREHQGGPLGAYRFKHALVQETAYRSLVRNDRRRTHAELAQTLEERFPNLVAGAPEVVARHWDESGEGERAIELYHRAGDHAMARSARTEAIEHYSRAITLLPRIDDLARRARRELALLVALGVPLVATRGYGNPDVERSHARARTLCAEVGEGVELYQALSGLFMFHSARAEIAAAARDSAELLAFGQRASDGFVTAWGHFFSSMPHYYRGENHACLEHLERALAVYPPAGPVASGYVHEHDVRVASHCYAAMTACSVGDAAQSLERIRQAIDCARASPHPFNLGFALSFATIVYFVRGDAAQVLATASAAVEICQEQEFPVYLGVGLMLRGWATARLGDPERGIAELRLGLAQAASAGTRIEAPRALAVLADAQLAAGIAKEALDAVATGLAIAEQKGTHFWDAELLRLRGEALLLQEGARDAEAGACFRGALNVARAQDARALELRAALSEAGRLHRRADCVGAKALLAPIVAGFDRATDLPDLRAAHSLLTSLG